MLYFFLYILYESEYEDVHEDESSHLHKIRNERNISAYRYLQFMCNTTFTHWSILLFSIQYTFDRFY